MASLFSGFRNYNVRNCVTKIIRMRFLVWVLESLISSPSSDGFNSTSDQNIHPGSKTALLAVFRWLMEGNTCHSKDIRLIPEDSAFMT